jgi:hypothetical protein
LDEDVLSSAARPEVRLSQALYDSFTDFFTTRVRAITNRHRRVTGSRQFSILTQNENVFILAL